MKAKPCGKKLHMLPTAVLLLFLTTLLAMLLFCYRAEETALRVLASSGTVTLEQTQYGSYGSQLGDGTALISAEEQISQSVRVITDALLICKTGTDQTGLCV